MTINDEPETEESQLGEESLSTSHLQEEITTYTVHEQGSKRGKPLLVSSDGFRYNVKKKQKTSVLWTCSSRSVTVPCYATVVQKGNDFVRGASDHKHGPEVSLNKKISIYVQVKRKAKENVYESTTAIAKNARQDFIQPNEPGLPKTETLSRIAIRHRAKFRPANPSDLNFVLDQDFLNCQDFLVADISQNNARHIIFASKEQLQLLSNTRRWFLDGTFKVVGELFSSGQLLSIHGFIVNGGVEKQVPMAFILMSRRRTEDYVKVLTSLQDALDEVVVENFVIDFEQDESKKEELKDILRDDMAFKQIVEYCLEADKGKTEPTPSKKAKIDDQNVAPLPKKLIENKNTDEKRKDVLKKGTSRVKKTKAQPKINLEKAGEAQRLFELQTEAVPLVKDVQAATPPEPVHTEPDPEPELEMLSLINTDTPSLDVTEITRETESCSTSVGMALNVLNPEHCQLNPPNYGLEQRVVWLESLELGLAWQSIYELQRTVGWLSQPGNQLQNQHTSVNQNLVNQNSVNQNLINQNSVNQTSVNQNSVNQNSVNQNSVNQNSVNQNSVNQNSVNQNSVNQNSVNQNFPIADIQLDVCYKENSIIGQFDTTHGQVYNNYTKDQLWSYVEAAEDFGKASKLLFRKLYSEEEYRGRSLTGNAANKSTPARPALQDQQKLKIIHESTTFFSKLIQRRWSWAKPAMVNGKISEILKPSRNNSTAQPKQ